MRVIAGSARGRPIVAPEGRTTRPIGDRAKEAIFNMLLSLGPIEGAAVVDLYAGSGSFGIECLSRGAAAVTFVERDRAALAALRANVETLGFTDRATIVTTGVEQALDGLGPVDLAFCDPPYAEDPWSDLLAALDAEIVVCHATEDVELPAGWDPVRRRRYGRSAITIAERLA